jgi:hypothetical protein
MRMRMTAAARRAAAIGVAAVVLSAGTGWAGIPEPRAARPSPAGTVGATGADPAAAGPFATLLFSRTEVTAADGCVPADRRVARLDTKVAPYLAARGLTATGSLTTGVIDEVELRCTHGGASMMASWTQASALAEQFGWSFVSHTATYPKDLAGLSPEQAEAETCGSAEAIDAHGLPGGHGLIAYPGAQPPPWGLQSSYGARCFAWGRGLRADAGVTPAAAATEPPYWQHTLPANGGACRALDRRCSANPSGARRYLPPSRVIAIIKSLEPGEWFTLQAFVLVRGRSPAYAASTSRWDCTSPYPRRHWTNDWERYCYRDWRRAVRALAARSDVTVTDPLTVGIAFGRTVPEPSPADPRQAEAPLPDSRD